MAADYVKAAEDAERARSFYLQDGQVRAAARAQSRIGIALRDQGKHSEGREQLAAALQVLRSEPDADTVRAILWLGELEVFTDMGEADRLTTEALTLGQGLAVDAVLLLDLLTLRGVYLSAVGRRTEAVAYLREAALLAEQSGDDVALGGVLLNLSDNLSASDPAAAAETARTAAGHLRRAGHRPGLIFATGNLVAALLLLGDWDAADDVLAQAADSDGLGDIEFLACYRAWLAALHGDAGTAQTVLTGLSDLRASEEVQDQAMLHDVEALTAAARRPARRRAHARAPRARARRCARDELRDHALGLAAGCPCRP